MTAQVGGDVRLAALRAHEAPGEVRRVGQPVLEIAAGHHANVAEISSPDPHGHFLDHGIVAVTEVDAVHDAGLVGDLDQLRRFLPVHGQRLLRQHVLAGLHGFPGNAVVILVRRTIVDRIDPGIPEHFLVVGTGFLDVVPRRRALRQVEVRVHHGGDLDAADPSKSFDVDRANVSGSDDCDLDHAFSSLVKVVIRPVGD